MAVYKYYNLQLLAIDTEEHGEVGPEGYKALFAEMSRLLSKAKSEKKLERVSGNLRGEFLFAPFEIVLKEKYAQGRFIKYDQVERVSNLYTNEDEFEGTTGSTSKRYEFLFVFDYSSHTLAIQLAKGLPNAVPFMRALTEILRPIADLVHPDYQLHLREMTSAQSLEQVFGAEAYKKVRVDVTFSNSADLEDALFENAGLMESDFKANNVHSVEHVERPARKGVMSGLSKIAMPLLVLAARFGNADVNYSKDGKNIHYHMKDYPVKEEVVHQRKESRDNYMARVHQSITVAREKTRVSEEVRRHLTEAFSPENPEQDENERGPE